MRKILSIIMLLPMLLSCGGGNGGENTALRLGAMSSMDYLPYVLAEKLGYYDSLGTDVEIVKFFSANDRDAALQSGNVDGTVIDFTGAVMQHANGVDVKLIAKHDGVFSLIASKASGIASLGELKGRKVAVSRNTVIEFATDEALSLAGISPDEVEKPEVNKIPVRLELLQSGAIDATLFPDPFTAIALASGHKLLATTVDMGVYVTGTVVRGDVLTSRRSDVEALLKGYDMAVEYMNTRPVAEWNSILVSDAGVPQALLDSVVLPQFKPTVAPSSGELEKTILWLKDKGLIPTSYSGEGLVDEGF